MLRREAATDTLGKDPENQSGANAKSCKTAETEVHVAFGRCSRSWESRREMTVVTTEMDQVEAHPTPRVHLLLSKNTFLKRVPQEDCGTRLENRMLNTRWNLVSTEQGPSCL